MMQGVWSAVLAGIGLAAVPTLAWSSPATNGADCAFYVNSFGLANAANQSFWLESEVLVSDALLARQPVEVGAAATYEVGAAHTPWSTTFVAGRTGKRFIIVMPFDDSRPDDASYRKIVSFNIYVSYRAANGRVVTEWVTDPATPFQPEDVFWGYPFYLRSRGTDANVTFTKYPSPIMALKNQCSAKSR